MKKLVPVLVLCLALTICGGGLANEPVPSSVLFGEEKAREDAGIQKETQAYLEKVTLKNIEIGKGVLGNTGVFGELKNTGKKTLRRVRLTVYFLDKEGNPIFEKEFLALCADCEMQIPRESPMKPGYSHKWGMKADDVPSEWAKKVDVKVVEVEFVN